MAAPPAPQAHPYRALAGRQITLGALLAALALLVMLAGGAAVAPLAASVILVGGAFVALGIVTRQQLDAVRLNNAAYELSSRGQIAEAEALLDQVRTRRGAAARAVRLQRATLAMRKADFAAAEHHASATLATPVSRFYGEADRVSDTVATALRALARASAGKDAEARADVAAVRASTYRSADALARAAVAEAVIFARKDERDALAACLRAAEPLLDFMAPRERALVRAFRRMLAAGGRSVYREPARVAEPAAEEPMLADWVGRLVPQAASFVAASGHRSESAAFDTAVPDSFVVGAGSEAIAREEKRRRRSPARLAVLVLLLCPFLGLLAAVGTSTAPGTSAMEQVSIVGGPFILILFAWRIGGAFRRARLDSAELRHAMLAVAAGDLERGERELTRLATCPRASTAASALYQRSLFAERRGDFKQALADCDAALARVTKDPATRAMQSDILLPELVGQRAFLLAALDRDQEATAELASLSREHPSFAFLSRSVLRVRLVLALRRRDVDAARAVAAQRTPELPLNRRDELLADLVSAAAGGRQAEAAAELERLRAELDEAPEVARWVDAVAPGLRGELAARANVRVAPAPAASEPLDDESDLAARALAAESARRA